MKRIIGMALALACLLSLHAQEESAPTNAGANIEEAISAGNCEALYAYLQNTKDRLAPNYQRAREVLEDYRKTNTITASYHTGKMEAIVNTVPTDMQTTVFDTPETSLYDVVHYLTDGNANLFKKVKIMHDWICNNITYDTDMFFSGKTENQDYASVLKAKKAVCSGYSNLLKEMCSLADIDAVVIDGYSKGYGYTGELQSSPDHAWNAVKISGKWYLVDATWDAGFVDGKTFVKRYSTEWLFLESKSFLYTHLPESNAYQFYAPCKTKEQFVADPKLTGKFFEYGFAADDSIPADTLAITHPKIVEIPLRTAGAKIQTRITNKNSGQTYNTVWAEQIGAALKIEVDVPSTDECTVSVTAQNAKTSRFPASFGIVEFESLVEQVNDYVDDGTLQFEDASYLQDSYFKVEDNGKYYLWEDQFAARKNASLSKIFALLIPNAGGEEVYSFTVKADGNYKGCGTENKYPVIHDDFYSAKATSLVSPKKATLNGDKETRFAVKSADFLNLALSVDGKEIPLPKNNSTGNFELRYTVPAGTPATIVGSRDRRKYVPLWSFNGDGKTEQTATSSDAK